MSHAACTIGSSVKGASAETAEESVRLIQVNDRVPVLSFLAASNSLSAQISDRRTFVCSTVPTAASLPHQSLLSSLDRPFVSRHARLDASPYRCLSHHTIRLRHISDATLCYNSV